MDLPDLQIPHPRANGEGICIGTLGGAVSRYDLAREADRRTTGKARTRTRTA